MLERCAQLGAPILVSANSLWRNNRFGGFNSYLGFDVALDSGGFVAMKRYGGYRWTPEQYAALARAMSPTWWAQMDYCCEPEIAADRSAVFARIDKTAASLHSLEDTARTNSQPLPMPVLQGWKPSDYTSGPIYDRPWPDLVGIGSVCRRHVNGPDGIVSVISALNAKVPPHVRFHLFGVKSTALSILIQRFPNRIHSIDSMAWNYSARVHARENSIPCNGELRANFLQNWYQKQTSSLKQSNQTELSL